MSDERILELFRKDNKEGFRLMYEKYADGLLTVCRRYSVVDDDAMDYLHESMLKIYDKMDSFRYNGEGSLFRWMTRVAVNMILDKKRRERHMLLTSMIENVDKSPEPSVNKVMGLTYNEICELLSRLSPIKGTVFKLFYLEEYSHKEIARLLRITEKGSSSILSKAKKELSVVIIDYLNNKE